VLNGSRGVVYGILAAGPVKTETGHHRLPPRLSRGAPPQRNVPVSTHWRQTVGGNAKKRSEYFTRSPIFIAPVESGRKDYISALSAVTHRLGAEELAKESSKSARRLQLDLHEGHRRTGWGRKRFAEHCTGGKSAALGFRQNLEKLSERRLGFAEKISVAFVPAPRLHCPNDQHWEKEHALQAWLDDRTAHTGIRLTEKGYAMHPADQRLFFFGPYFASTEFSRYFALGCITRRSRSKEIRPPLRGDHRPI